MSISEADLSIEDLCFTYPAYPGIKARILFEGLNLRIQAGRIAVLLAQPDQGKTTLCRILSGLIPRFSGGTLTGRMSLADAALTAHQPYELLERVGLIFQQPGEQLLTSRCDAEIAFALESLGVPRNEIEKRIRNVLQTMHLERYRSESPQMLSGGEKKKLLIACLLAIDPQLWLLDETLEELDAATKKQLLELLKQGRRTTLILSAKWHELFAVYADRILLLEDGTVQSISDGKVSREFRDLLCDRGFLLREPADGEKRCRHEAGEKRNTSEAIHERKAGAAEKSATLLLAENLRFRYRREGSNGEECFSLQIDSFHIEAGQTTALIGHNGSGKSTIGHILCGLIEPEQGIVRIRKHDRLQPASTEELNRFTGYLFQDPDLQIFLPTVFEELALGLKNRNVPAGQIQERVQQAIALFELPSTEAPPSMMSYGIRKKLQAAVYYLLERPLMIIDEGDSGLSANEFAEMVHIFRKTSSAVIFITHDRCLAEGLADRVVEMRSGSLV